jgi:superoxide dismutase, Fe-Mn family
VPRVRGMSPSSNVTRRTAVIALGAGAALTPPGRAQTVAPAAGPLPLPKLGYAYDALEPHIDARTMEIHHSKHHQAYVTNANAALAKLPELARLKAEEIVRSLDRAPEASRAALRNNVGGHLNHALFWETVGPKGGGAPTGELAAAITAAFGSLDAFKSQFGDAAMKTFGSGWAWLVLREGKLAVKSLPNQDSPLMEGARPVLGLDVWEHAYYLKYQNRRADYVTAFWSVVRWDRVAERFALAKRA